MHESEKQLIKDYEELFTPFVRRSQATVPNHRGLVYRETPHFDTVWCGPESNTYHCIQECSSALWEYWVYSKAELDWVRLDYGALSDLMPRAMLDAVVFHINEQ